MRPCAGTAALVFGLLAVALAAYDLSPGGGRAAWPHAFASVCALTAASFRGRPLLRASGAFVATWVLLLAVAEVATLHLAAGAARHLLGP